MKARVHVTVLWLIASLCLLLNAEAAEISLGQYYLPNGRGVLSVIRKSPALLAFSIETSGSNGHVCNLSGDIENGVGRVIELGIKEQQPEMICRVAFDIQSSDVVLVTGTDSGCRYYCGARAGFSGKYKRPQSQCLPSNRQASRDRFLKLYREKSYFDALEVIQPLYQECGELYDYTELDAIRNDIAVTQYHLNMKQACMATLKSTFAAQYPSKEELKAFLPPFDFDRYEPVAESTWNNLKLCRNN